MDDQAPSCADPLDPTLERLRDLARQDFDLGPQAADDLVSAEFEELISAQYLALDTIAVSLGAQSLIASILDRYKKTPTWKEPKRRQNESARNLKVALEAFVGQLLLAAAKCSSFGSIQSKKNAAPKPGWVFRSTAQDSFTGEEVSRRSFELSRKVLMTLGLVEVKTGGWDRVVKRGRAGRYRATQRLMAEARTHGLTAENLHQHFAREPKVEPLILKSSRAAEGVAKGTSHRVAIEETDERAKVLRDEVELVNNLVRRSVIEGTDLRGFQRVFNLGDVEGHGWQNGGRVFAVSADDRSYQQMSKEERLRLLINGERVVELDIGACYLTIALGLFGDGSRDFSVDLYEGVAGLPRPVTKAWLTCFFGKRGPLGQWPSEVRERVQRKSKGEFNLKDYPVKVVRDHVYGAFPELLDWETRGLSVYQLMEIESDVVFGTVVEFARRGTLLLPVHDGLLCPIHTEKDVKSTLERRFSERVPAVVPRISRTDYTA